MLARKLKSASPMLVKRINKCFWVVAFLLDRVGAEASEGILSPVRGFEVQEVRQVFVGLCAHEFEKRFEEGVQRCWIHYFDALSEGLGDLDAEFFGSGHDPAVRGHGGVGEDAGFVDGCSGRKRRGIVDELVVVLGPEDFGEFDKDFSEGTVGEGVDSVLDGFWEGRTEVDHVVTKAAKRNGDHDSISSKGAIA